MIAKDPKRKAKNQLQVVTEGERQRAIEYFLKKETEMGRPNPEVRRFTSKTFGGRALLMMFSSQRKAREFALFLHGLTPASSTRLKAGVWKASTQVKKRRREEGGKGKGKGKGGAGAGAGWNKDG